MRSSFADDRGLVYATKSLLTAKHIPQEPRCKYRGPVHDLLAMPYRYNLFARPTGRQQPYDCRVLPLKAEQMLLVNKGRFAA